MEKRRFETKKVEKGVALISLFDDKTNLADRIKLADEKSDPHLPQEAKQKQMYCKTWC